MSELIQLRSFDTVAVWPLSVRPAGVYTTPLYAEGSQLLSTVFVESMDAGATLEVAIIDLGLSEQPVDRVRLGAHEIHNTAPSVSKLSVVNFHDRPLVQTTITGGSVKYGQWTTLKPTATDPFDHGQGHLAATVGSTQPNTIKLVPTAPGRYIRQLAVRCAIDQPMTRRLKFSFNGSDWIVLAPGESFSVAPRGELKQLYLDGGTQSVKYEVVTQSTL